MIVTVYEKRVDIHMHPVVSRFVGVHCLKCIDGELQFECFRPWKSDFRPYRIKDYFYYTVENDPDSPEDL